MKKDVYILGIHGFSSKSKRSMHNSGVALVKNGEVIFATDEERYSRIKNDGAFPLLSLKELFEQTQIKPSEIDLVVLPDRNSYWQLFKIFQFGIKTFLQTGVFLNNYYREAILRLKDNARYLTSDLESVKVMEIEHHLLHAASAYYTCPWNNTAIVTIDGMGDFSMSGINAVGINGDIRILKRNNGFYSPGLYYMIITEILGFVSGKHEGKVTGLAAFGKENKELKKIFEDFIKYEESKVDYYSKNVAFEINDYISRKWVNGFNPEHGTNSFDEQEYLRQKPFQLQSFRKKLVGFSKEDIAFAAQNRLEEIVLTHIKTFIKETKLKKLVLAGGVFANVKLNQKIKDSGIVDDIYVYPAMNDSGLSAGAALYGYYKILNNKFIPKTPPNVLLGRKYKEEEIELVLKQTNLNFFKSDNVEIEIAKMLSIGLIIAHFNGKAEYGPRALGNRSIFVSAKDSNINETLNKRLKRTEFMPFAPVILEDFAAEYISNWNKESLTTPFMTMTFKVTKKCKEVAPAIVHTDYTARPQVVNELSNPRLYRILDEYNRITGIPILINTSFNLHEEPIVNSPNDAIKVLETNGADILVINDFIIKK